MKNFFLKKLKKISDWYSKFDNPKSPSSMPLITFYTIAFLMILPTSFAIPHDEFQVYISMMELGALIGAVITSFTRFKFDHDSMSITVSKTSQLVFLTVACILIAVLHNQKTVAYGLIPGFFLGRALWYTYKYIASKKKHK